MVKTAQSVMRYDFETPEGRLLITCRGDRITSRFFKNPDFVPAPKARRVRHHTFVPRRRLEPVLPLAGRAPLTSSLTPLPDEALLSWLLRSATHLGLSMEKLAEDGFGVVDYSAHSTWRRRPRLKVLERIRARTGIDVAHLQAMTLADWNSYRNDEATQRFGQRVYEGLAPHRRLQRWAVCRQCLESDSVPYLRRSWMIGWLGVCPDHGRMLIDRCDACGARPSAAPLGSTRLPFSPRICRRCGNELDGFDRPARPSEARLQGVLLQGKQTGHLELAGIGRLSWRETVALIDVILGTLWTGLTGDELHGVWAKYRTEIEREPLETGVWGARYRSLKVLAWLLEGWPQSAGSVVATELFARWLTRGGNHISRHVLGSRADRWQLGCGNFNPRTRDRLLKLYEATLSSRNAVD